MLLYIFTRPASKYVMPIELLQIITASFFIISVYYMVKAYCRPKRGYQANSLIQNSRVDRSIVDQRGPYGYNKFESNFQPADSRVTNYARNEYRASDQISNRYAEEQAEKFLQQRQNKAMFESRSVGPQRSQSYSRVNVEPVQQRPYFNQNNSFLSRDTGIPCDDIQDKRQSMQSTYPDYILTREPLFPNNSSVLTNNPRPEFRRRESNMGLNQSMNQGSVQRGGFVYETRPKSSVSPFRADSVLSQGSRGLYKKSTVMVKESISMQSSTGNRNYANQETYSQAVQSLKDLGGDEQSFKHCLKNIKLNLSNYILEKYLDENKVLEAYLEKPTVY